MDTYQMTYALCCFLQLLELRLGNKHQMIVLSKNKSGSAFYYTVDGATVMSEEFYRDQGLSQIIILRPSLPSHRFMLQFVYIDIEESSPCQDSLMICELSASFMSPTCVMPMVPAMCGTLNELFEKSQKRHMITQPGHNIRLEWKTRRPSGKHRGFRILVTAISNYGEGTCPAGSRWRCSDNTCIAPELHCDKIPHCLDISDEVVNCSNSDLLPSIYKCNSGGGTFPCVSTKWNERWFGVAIPMLIVLVLFLVAFVVKIRNMICRPAESQGGMMASHLGIWQVRPARRRRRRSSRSRSHNSEAGQLGAQSSNPQFQSNLYADLLCRDSLHGTQTGGQPAAYDPVNMMLLPPPYSPPLYASDQYQPPTEGEPPPIYEEFETTRSSAHSHCQQHAQRQTLNNEDDKDAPAQSINQNC